MTDRYYSQDGQDEFLDTDVFAGRQSGFFVDVGAHDGVTFSNTAFFERARGWSGICIEPHPDVFPELVRNRASTNVHCCVSSTAGTVEFSAIHGYSQMLSGIGDRYSREHRQRIESELREHGGSIETTLVKASRLDTLLRLHGVDQIDYLSIDTEGSELDVLDSIDFEEFTVHAISVENNDRSERLGAFLTPRGFQEIRRVGADDVYVNRRGRYWSRSKAIALKFRKLAARSRKRGQRYRSRPGR